MHGAGKIRIALPLAIGEWMFEHALPCFRFQVVLVDDLIAIAAAAIAIHENEFSFRATKEFRVGGALLLIADHGRDAHKCASIEGLFAAEVIERNAMHVATEVDVSFVIEGHREIVVTVPTGGDGKFREGPCFLLQSPLGDGQLSFVIIVSHKLMWRMSQ